MHKRIIASVIAFAFLFTQCGLGAAALVYNKEGRNLRNPQKDANGPVEEQVSSDILADSGYAKPPAPAVEQAGPRAEPQAEPPAEGAAIGRISVAELRTPSREEVFSGLSPAAEQVPAKKRVLLIGDGIDLENRIRMLADEANILSKVEINTLKPEEVTEEEMKRQIARHDFVIRNTGAEFEIIKAIKAVPTTYKDLLELNRAIKEEMQAWA